jgi:hypothetical protein
LRAATSIVGGGNGGGKQGGEARAAAGGGGHVAGYWAKSAYGIMLHMNMKRTVYAVIGLGLLALLAGGIVWAVVGRGDGTTSVGVSHPVTTVDDMREFEEFPVYWLGESFQGLPLAAVQRIDYPGAFPGKPYNDPRNEVAFIYGDCTIPPGETGCPMPLSIDIVPYCDVPPEVIADAVKTGPQEEIRGATVQRTGKSSMRLWTGDVSIGIHATEEGLLDEAVRNLVRLNGDKPSSPEEPLGPPDQIECPPLPWSPMPISESITETTTECHRSGTPIPCPNVTPSPTPSSP